MDIPFHILRALLKIALFLLFFLLVYHAVIQQPGGNMYAAVFVGLFGGYAAMALTYTILALLYCTLRDVWQKEIYPYLHAKLVKQPTYHWPDTRP